MPNCCHEALISLDLVRTKLYCFRAIRGEPEELKWPPISKQMKKYIIILLPLQFRIDYISKNPGPDLK